VCGDKGIGLLDTKSYIGIDNQFSTAHDALIAAKQIADKIAAEDESARITIGNHVSIISKINETKTVAVYSEDDWNRGLR
jgi:hypothetical protein